MVKYFAVCVAILAGSFYAEHAFAAAISFTVCALFLCLYQDAKKRS